MLRLSIYKQHEVLKLTRDILATSPNFRCYNIIYGHLNYSSYRIKYKGDPYFIISTSGIIIYKAGIDNMFDEIYTMFDLKPFKYAFADDVDPTKYTDSIYKPFLCRKIGCMLCSRGKPYIYCYKTLSFRYYESSGESKLCCPDPEYQNVLRLDYDSCLYIGYRRLTSLCKNIHLYQKRLICIDFHGKTIKSQPWIEKRLRLVFTMGALYNRRLDKVIYRNYGKNCDLIITQLSEVDTHELMKLTRSDGDYTDFVIDYFGLLRCDIKSARKNILLDS